MKNIFSSHNLSRPARRRVDLAIAVAQERLLSTHVDHALDLVGLVGDDVPFDDALDIYARMLRLSEDEARVVTTRSLATLGARVAEDTEAWPEQVPAPDEPKRPHSQSLLSHLRQRVRGRINDDARRWIELDAARAEVALLQAHVENGLHFVEILDGEMPAAEAVELYLDALDVRDAIAEVVYYFALARLSEQLLPTRPPRPTAVEPADAGRDESGEGRRLRVVESDGG